MSDDPYRRKTISDSDRLNWLSKRVFAALIHHEDGSGFIRLSRNYKDKELFDIRAFIDEAIILEDLPPLFRNEVPFEFCLECGADFMAWPGKCSNCSSTRHIRLGAMQGALWRHQKFQK